MIIISWIRQWFSFSEEAALFFIDETGAKWKTNSIQNAKINILCMRWKFKIADNWVSKIHVDILKIIHLKWLDAWKPPIKVLRV